MNSRRLLLNVAFKNVASLDAASVDSGLEYSQPAYTAITHCDIQLMISLFVLLTTIEAYDLYGLFSTEDIAIVTAQRLQWSNNLFRFVEDFYNLYGTSKLGHRFFDIALGPIGPKCRDLQVFGSGDEEKRVCGSVLSTDVECTVVSVGGNNQWGFESELFRRTLCNIYVFDCTVQLEVPPELRSRVYAIQVCIGNRTFTADNGWHFATWTDALSSNGIWRVSHLKMDIEGYEYEVLESILASTSEREWPLQVSLELHYETQMKALAWHSRQKTPAEVALFIKILFDNARYFVIDRRDNSLCPHCSEIVLMRIPTAAITENFVPTAAITTENFVPRKQQWLPENRSCAAWFTGLDISSNTPVPKIPHVMHDAFSMWGQAVVEHEFYSQVYLGAPALSPRWTRKEIEDQLAVISEGGRSKETYANAARLFHSAFANHSVKGLYGAVVGSETPWVEILCLAAGAVHVTTIEYGQIVSEHSRISTITTAQLRDQCVSGRIPQFDFVVSYSSLEHSGLGRYGDALAPFGDLEWLERIKCMLKPDGFLFFGVPMSQMDCIVFNAHRIYGPVRLSYVTRGFHVLSQFGEVGKSCGDISQPILVLKLKAKSVEF
jgi:hypothetical protein